MKKHILPIILAIMLTGCSINSTPTPKSVNKPTEAVAEPTENPITTKETPTDTPYPEPTDEITPTDVPTGPVSYGPSDFPENINPLTGLAVSDPSILNRHPISVKISIYPRFMSRPPWGLSSADIVYDYYHNNGYSRLHAIFYGTDVDEIGPIRSGRLLDDILVQSYKSIFAYGSADARINNVFFNSNYSSRLAIEPWNKSCPPSEKNPFCRVQPSGPNHLLTGTNVLTGYIEEDRGIAPERQDLDGLLFEDEIPEGGEVALSLITRYSADSYNKWEYDENAGNYLRFQDNLYDRGQGEQFKPLVDRLNNQQVAAENVIVLFVPHDYFYKTATSEIVEIDLNGLGNAVLFRDGKAYELFWTRPAAADMVTIIDSDGNPFPLKPGKSWFQVVGVASEETIEDGAWRYQFFIP